MTSQTHRIRARARPAGAATAAIGVSILLTITIGLLGPSAMVPALSGPAWHPPFSLGVEPDARLVIALAATAVVLGGLGLLLALREPGFGRLPKAQVFVLVGCVAAGVLAFLPPSGSGDHLNYAAYGRMVTLGLSPYTHGADDLPGDPIADAVERPWREEPSVYGPVATAVQALASWIGGDSLRLTMFVLAAVNAAAFIATALLIDRFTRDDPARRLRAALLWTANPLLLYQLVAGMHADTLAIACMVAALLARSRPMGAGALLGLGVAIKVNAGLVALGPAWELRRHPRRLALMAGCAVAVVVAGYAIVGPEAIAPMTRTSKSISHASPWKLVQGWIQVIVGPGSAYRGEIQIGSLLLLALIAWALLRLASLRGMLTPLRTPGNSDRPRTRGGALSEPGALGKPALSEPDELGKSDVLGRPEALGGPEVLDKPDALGGIPDTAGTAGTLGKLDAVGKPDMPDTAGVPGALGVAGSPRTLGMPGAGRTPDALGTGMGVGRGVEAPVVAAGLMVAYLFATPYILPWYDGLAFGLLALVAASALDTFMVAHLLVLSVAYLPARVDGVPAELDWLSKELRPQLAWVLLALTVALVVWAWRAARPVRRPRASAAPPPSAP
ncbi:hypothetical protein BKM31_44975 [[Actinomadura] parvosata subsp. kistnae]|uniref:DUF2029 domain-containing protein n=1 Tax=[Actinomadura] parvosata subsp. kistnae TaxID=1909395 RepID=A0A1V0ABW0_9ACTN|nr:hypothetical protein BKM31_44975 [Nonomuraea sp. ATCC 55076]